MNKVCCNGIFFDEGGPLLGAANRSFRYGDGLFETIKVWHNQPLLFQLHWQRAMSGLQTLEIEATHLVKEDIASQMQALCNNNNCTAAARIRWALWRDGEGKAQYIIQASALDETAFILNEKGWSLDVYRAVYKSQDMLSNLKSANYLPYVMAGRYAAAQNLDECLVLNAEGNVCDGSKTNIFLVRDGVLFTPALHQGCVAGVMRQYLIQTLKANRTTVYESIISEADILSANEVFVTNAIQGIRWVSAFGNKQYGNSFSKQLYQRLLAPLYNV